MTDMSPAFSDLDPRISTGSVTTNGIDFAYLEAGSGPLALCVHGFPDTAYTWRHLLPRLAGAGFHAVAPFTRGYAPTSLAPDGDYRQDALADDLAALHEALGGDGDAVLIGHDWGGVTAYHTGDTQADRWSRLVVLAIPPPPSIQAAFFTYDQIRRSSYMFIFLHPLADMIVANDDLAFIDRLWGDWSPGYADRAADVDAVRAAIGPPEHLAAALGYYRAMLDPDTMVASMGNPRPVPPNPILYLHGADDGCMGSEIVENAQEHLPPGSRVEIVDGCGHFLHLERPDVVNELILAHLS